MNQELTLVAPPGLIEPLRKLLNATPDVTYKERGWFEPKKITITGPREAIERLLPQVGALQGEYVSREAW